MRRRNVQSDGKRRPPPALLVKRTKVNLLESSQAYLQLVFQWVVVLAMDYYTEFRIEYLWTLGMFLLSIYDSFKYQGFSFSMFFILIVFTSDIVCFLFIPVHWLFMAASMYAWVLFVWYTGKGISLPIVLLCILFISAEVAVCLKECRLYIDIKTPPFNFDLCRPFAAHSIGYPAVTLGFGLKRWLKDIIYGRRQKENQKKNETLYSIVLEALPPESCAREDTFNPLLENDTNMTAGNADGRVLATAGVDMGPESGNKLCNEQRPVSTSELSKSSSISKLRRLSPTILSGHQADSFESVGALDTLLSDECDETSSASSNSNSKSVSAERNSTRKGKEASGKRNEKEVKLESDVKRLKCDMQLSKNREAELNEQIVSIMNSERNLKSQVSSLLVDNAGLEARVTNMTNSKAVDKEALASLEKKLREEKKLRKDLQHKLEVERRGKKEANAECAQAKAQHSEDSNCIQRLESKVARLTEELVRTSQRANRAEEEIVTLRQSALSQGDLDQLIQALNQAQDKQKVLEYQLSSETKVKMDLFSALGEARRLMIEKENLISELEGKVLKFLVSEAEGDINDTHQILKQ